jgi:formamidopyrimidine-DNA glycosylase
MPELPEVETVVRDLRPLLCGKRIASIKAGRRKLRQPWQRAWANKLMGQRINAVRRRGKWIILDLEKNAHLLVHLGMTGQFTVEHRETLPAAHTHIIFGLNDGGDELRFCDIRRFGSVRYFSVSSDMEQILEAGLGPEPWDLVAEVWHGRIHGSRRCLKAILLDQKVVAGVGNIYADEALFEARLSPKQLGTRTSVKQAERLLLAIVKVMDKAIKHRGSTIRNYVGGSGLKGQFQEEFQVYGRTGKPCSACARPIARIRLAGRSTHYCPRCQSNGHAKIRGKIR